LDLYNGDCLEVLVDIPDNSVDAIICDPPYGTTSCPWDAVIPFEPMWEQLLRVLKPYRAIVLFSQQPFTTELISSNKNLFKYQWIWFKTRPSGVAQAKNKPMAIHEDILVFSEGVTVHACQTDKRVPYFPQGLTKVNKIARNSKDRAVKNVTKAGALSYRPSHKDHYLQEFTGYPSTLLDFPVDNTATSYHPTQKPISLMEYLIRTYTEEGETVLDFTMGSGSTGVGCKKSGRKFIGIEKDPDYFEVAKDRIERTREKTGFLR